MWQGLVVWVGLVTGQGPAPPQAPTPPQAPVKRESEYQWAVRRGKETGKPVAVFVGQKARKLTGWVSCEAELKGFPPVCVVVFWKGDWYLVKGATPDDQTIRSVTEEPAVPSQGVFFQEVPMFSAPLLRGGGC